MDSFSEKFQNTQTYSNSLLVKIKNFEETFRNQQQKIFELESIIENSNSSSESMTKKISTYESSIQHQKRQVESLLKKLQGSNADNEFLVQKLTLLTQSLRNYQYQLETLTSKLQSSKTIIASAHAELAKANAQLSKYQAALSSCYILNGQLMTKVSGMSSMAQFQSSFDSKFDILNLSQELSMGSSSKTFDFNTTSSLLEATGSETYVSFIKAAQTPQEANMENGTATAY
jgi:predicted RNase H-like nuclease (RuvC/YqgF family)